MDGAKVMMTAQDRELLKNYDQVGEEDEEKILERAITSDFKENLSISERKKTDLNKKSTDKSQTGGLRLNPKMKKVVDTCAKTKAVQNLKEKAQKKRKQQ